jgi:hypothetical protein
MQWPNCKKENFLRAKGEKIGHRQWREPLSSLILNVNKIYLFIISVIGNGLIKRKIK